MLRREEKAKVVHYGGVPYLRPRPLGKGKREYTGKWAPSDAVRLNISGWRSTKVARQVLSRGAKSGGLRTWFLYRGKFYSTAERMSEEEATALLGAKELKKSRELDRARVLLRTTGLSGQRRRLPIPDAVKVLVWQRDNGRCVNCGSNEGLEFDHIIPLSIGGSNTARNLQLLCEACNREKGGSL
jgi:hypothetical protein